MDLNQGEAARLEQPRFRCRFEELLHRIGRQDQRRKAGGPRADAKEVRSARVGADHALSVRHGVQGKAFGTLKRELQEGTVGPEAGEDAGIDQMRERFSAKVTSRLSCGVFSIFQ